MLFYICRFVAESVLHLPYPSPKTLWICTNPTTQHGRGRVGGTCPPVATLLFLEGYAESESCLQSPQDPLLPCEAIQGEI